MNLDCFSQDNTKNGLLQSSVPACCKEEPCMIGIDEAGRGPVLGPMVYGAAFCPVSKSEELKGLGVADSKTLTEDQRENIFKIMEKNNEYLGWMLEIHSPNVICNSMLRRCKHSLNAVSQDSAVGLINGVLQQGVNLQEVYVDTVGQPEKYEKKLSELFPDLKMTVAKQADSIYPIVSAASICAKVARDHALKFWRFLEGSRFDEKDYGSGYPGDPLTKKFIAENVDPVFGFPQLVRFSWSTAGKILQSKAAAVTWDKVDEEADVQQVNTKTLLNFFQRIPSSPKKKKMKCHPFFTGHCLSQVTSSDI